MFYWIYDILPWQFAVLVATIFVGVTWVGILLISPILKLWLKGQEGINDVIGYVLSAVGVFYGLLLGLLAVATYQNFTAVEATVGKEAASLAALYRDVSAYPEPARADLQTRLRGYTTFIIDTAWPAQRKGEIATGSVQMMDDFQAAMAGFEPATKGQEIVHAEAFRQFNDMILLRRERLQSVGTGIPGVMWWVVAVGAVINTFIILCFRLRFDIHLVVGGVLSLFVGMLIFLVAVLDHPFRGKISVGADAFELVQSTIMKK